ncbi:MAG: C-GCAxxG-C-C family (seleno)protein [Patescibacteria group bacterium]
MEIKKVPEWENKAKEYFNSGYNCSESVFKTILEYKGENTNENLNMATGFGGGMGRTGYTCGVVTGAVLALNYFYGRKGPEEDKLACYEKVNLFIEEYNKKFGGINCTKYGYGKNSEQEDFDCDEYVGYAVKITINIIEK